MNARMATVLVCLITIAGVRQTRAQDKVAFDGFKIVDKDGNIAKPDDYRDRYQMLGAYTVIDPKGNQIHFTYASPGAAAYYRRNKTFADGTVLVKEILGTDHAQLTYGGRQLGHRHQGLVCPDQGCEKAATQATPVGRWLGLGTVQIRRSRHASCN